jgi:hypothetical protein
LFFRIFFIYFILPAFFLFLIRLKSLVFFGRPALRHVGTLGRTLPVASLLYFLSKELDLAARSPSRNYLYFYENVTYVTPNWVTPLLSSISYFVKFFEMKILNGVAMDERENLSRSFESPTLKTRAF